MEKTITLAHGNGGKLTHELISSLFLPAFRNPALEAGADSALLELPPGRVVFTTDSHVVTPLFFPGGDIGKLAVNGTVNDLAVMGARPLYLSCGFIIEDGFAFSELERVTRSMAEAAREAGVQIVTGDTKVVEKGAVDGLFVNTSGVGVLRSDAPAGVASIRPGDAVILSGTIGDHGMAIYAGREGIELQTSLQSDCAAITPLVELALSASAGIRVMRDPTRGGLATTLNEFTSRRPFGIELDERALPVREEVRGVCELLGFDPLFVANEGKLVLIASPDSAEAVVEALRGHALGREAAIIGRVTERAPGRVYLRTLVGGERILDMLTGDMLPRIC
ncbi:MAG: hydrogenase expression/formation protein HypE [Oligoflexia bacterium]|nr:hydrogenase expression/formation protein HypE [Oligoflexia bacterium]